MPSIQQYFVGLWRYLKRAKKDSSFLVKGVEKTIRILRFLLVQINNNQIKNIVIYLPDVDFDLKVEIQELISLLSDIFILRFKDRQQSILDEALESIEHILYFDDLQRKQELLKKTSIEFMMGGRK